MSEPSPASFLDLIDIQFWITTIKYGMRKKGRGQERGRGINYSDVNHKRVDKGNMTTDAIVLSVNNKLLSTELFVLITFN